MHSAFLIPKNVRDIVLQKFPDFDLGRMPKTVMDMFLCVCVCVCVLVTSYCVPRLSFHWLS